VIYLFGLFVAITSISAAILHLHQEATHFWDFVAFACVSGGTVAVALMTFPWQYRKQIVASLRRTIWPPESDEGESVRRGLSFVQRMRDGRLNWSEPVANVSDEVFRDGAELMSLGFGKEKIHAILEERILQSFERAQKISNSFRGLSKYPPAFGLAGTVLGLVTLMRKVSEGADAKQTGLMMAIALMATFYGLLTSNLLINPTGENMNKTALAERKNAEIALHAVLLAVDRVSLLEAQEVLNSYLSHDQRVNVISSSIEAEAA
jgi:chemotaxis protein MotA